MPHKVRYIYVRYRRLRGTGVMLNGKQRLLAKCISFDDILQKVLI
jgi:hypothetical protein